MATKYLFTIVDAISEKAGNIFTCDTIAEAERQFYDALKNAQDGSLFKTHPTDFSLMLVGQFNDKSFQIVDAGHSTAIATGKKLVDTVPPFVRPEATAA